MAEAPVLFYQNPQTIIDRMIAKYSELVNRPIEKAQAESLLIHTMAAEIVLMRASADAAVSSMLAEFSTSPMLDYLAGNVGVTRLAAAPAETTLQFNLISGHGPVTIPAGTKVRSQDGLMVFATDSETFIPTGTNSVQVTATANLDGPQGNLYAPGLISDLIDAQPFVSSVANTDVTGGGSDTETDEGLRRRILIAQNQFTTAGSFMSYRYWALSANPSIIDVEIVTPKDSEGGSIGGQVLIYPLVAGGETTPQAILDAVEEAVSSDYRRPVNDKVRALSPARVEYTIPLDITLKYGVVQSFAETAIIQGISKYTIAQSKKLGADITAAQIIAAAMTPDVHSIRLPGFTDIVVSKTEFPVCVNIAKISTNYENVNA